MTGGEEDMQRMRLYVSRDCHFPEVSYFDWRKSKPEKGVG